MLRDEYCYSTSAIVLLGSSMPYSRAKACTIAGAFAVASLLVLAYSEARECASLICVVS